MLGGQAVVKGPVINYRVGYKTVGEGRGVGRGVGGGGRTSPPFWGYTLYISYIKC